MLKLYYSKGSSAIAAHILLEEAGAEYKAIEVSILEEEHRSLAFLARNPKGRIPILETPDGIITENPAILEYIAGTHPNAGLRPKGDFARAQTRSLAAYICATVHVAFAHSKRGRRWVSEATSLRDMQSFAPRNLKECAEFLEKDLALSPWVQGPDYSYCDPYVFLLNGWLSAVGGTLADTPRLAAHHQAMLARPATQAVMALHL